VFAAPKYQLSLGVRTGLEPSGTAHKYAKRLNDLEEELQRELGEPVTFDLKMFRLGSQTDELLAQGSADFMLMSAADFLRTSEKAPGLVPLALEKHPLRCVIFARTDSGLERLEQLRGKSIAFPDPSSTMNFQAKAQLAGAGVFKTDLRAWTNFVDQLPDAPPVLLENNQPVSATPAKHPKKPRAGEAIVGQRETLLRVFKREYDAGVTTRKLFETSPYSQLVAIASFEAPSDLYVARAAKNKVDQKTIQAFQNAVVRRLGATPIDAGYFKNLREAMEKSRQFDGRPATSSISREARTGANP
jgi:hypothetical protein